MILIYCYQCVVHVVLVEYYFSVLIMLSMDCYLSMCKTWWWHFNPRPLSVTSVENSWKWTSARESRTFNQRAVESTHRRPRPRIISHRVWLPPPHNCCQSNIYLPQIAAITWRNSRLQFPSDSSQAAIPLPPSCNLSPLLAGTVSMTVTWHRPQSKIAILCNGHRLLSHLGSVNLRLMLTWQTITVTETLLTVIITV